MVKNVALTTIDNPWNPFTQFEDWDAFDRSKGYCTLALIARLAMTSDQLPDKENEREVLRAMDRVMELDFMNIYKKVYDND